MQVDEYISTVIGRGDEGSKLLAAICAPTLKNSKFVDIVAEGMNGIAVTRFPENNLVVVHSRDGDQKEMEPARHTRSMVDNLVNGARAFGVTPQGFADVVDASKGDKPLIEEIGNALVERANLYGLPILNGELAILGARVNCPANVSGTMISTAEKGGKIKPGVFKYKGVTYAAFDPKGMSVYMNSDGIGTKTEFYERAGLWHPSLEDSLAMKVDDSIKLGATVKVVSDVVEIKGSEPPECRFGHEAKRRLEYYAERLGKKIGFTYILQREQVGNRIRGYNDSAPAFNISGSAVSVIDEERLKHLPKPSAGEYILAVRGKPNPRSNGITDKRKMMVMLFGENWHKTEIGKIFLEYLAAPSTILYPVFKELMDKGLATSVYHMSGGAYNGKLAKPLAKYNLFASLGDLSIDNLIEPLFEPDWRELTLAGANFTSAETAYAKWPMGNDGFPTTANPGEAIKAIEAYGLEARVVGKVEKTKRTGIELKAFNGEKVYFSGKE